MTHGSPELDEDARKLVALGADPGPQLHDIDPEPDRNANYYQWLCWWYRQPKNQAKAAEIERCYIEAMQRDPKLD